MLSAAIIFAISPVFVSHNQDDDIQCKIFGGSLFMNLNCSEGQANVLEHFPRISKNFRKFGFVKRSDCDFCP